MAKKAPKLSYTLTETIKTTRKRRFVLSAAHIRGLLGLVGVEVPSDAEIYMDVPGGGEWSNQELLIEDAKGLVVSFEEEDTTEESSIMPWEVIDVTE